MDAAPVGLPGYRQRALAALLCFWLLASFLAIGDALGSDWAPFGQLPTAEQVARARANAEGAAVLAVVPPLAGLVLARRWRSAGWTATYLVGLMLAVLTSGVLVWLTDSPVVPG
jgi:hypothetical protein